MICAARLRVTKARKQAVSQRKSHETHNVMGIANSKFSVYVLPAVAMQFRTQQENHDRHVQLAFEVFCYRARKYIGVFLASMGGADAVIFTGGTGENSPEVGGRICEAIEWAGLKIDATKNQQTVGHEGLVGTDDS